MNNEECGNVRGWGIVESFNCGIGKKLGVSSCWVLVAGCWF